MLKVMKLRLLLLFLLVFIGSSAHSSGLAQAGKELFFEVKLSGDGLISCASCHRADRHLQDGFERALARSRVLTRNTPSLLNINRHTVFFWDGRAVTLAGQLEGPLFNRLELGATDESLMRAINSSPTIQSEWRSSGKSPKQFVLAALEAHVLSMRPGPTRFERYLAGQKTLSDLELKGWKLFSGKFSCVECHQPPNLTDNKFHKIGLPPRNILIQTKAPIGSPDRYELGQDFGRGNIESGKDAIHAFRTPSLYYVSHTAPYMHDGSHITLEQLLSFYSLRREKQQGKERFTPEEERALLALFTAFSE